jgi:hypothetical protein
MRNAVLATIVSTAWASAACDADLKIIYEVSGGAGQCKKANGTPAETCHDVSIQCDAVFSLRILEPGNPLPPVSICQDIVANAAHDLCPIGGINLPENVTVPKETLEIQVVVWSKEAVFDAEHNKLDCLRNEVVFQAATGFPIATTPGGPSPALGGRAFFHPGESETVVELGCTDPQAVNDVTCSGAGSLVVTSAVIDFDSRVSVSSDEANHMSVAIGKPIPKGLGFELPPGQLKVLDLSVLSPPAWRSELKDFTLGDTTCMAVAEDTFGAPVTLHCVPTSPEQRTVDIAGIRLIQQDLDEILMALKLPMFPQDGITIGIVVDAQNNALTNVNVSGTSGTVQYLTATRNGVVANGVATTASGIFVSTDASYGTIFTGASGFKSATAIGGNVSNKVTIALLQFSDVVGM